MASWNTGSRASRRVFLKGLGIAAAAATWPVVQRGAVRSALAAPPPVGVAATDFFARTWARADKPVADGAVSRTWMWGPSPVSDVVTEAYAQSPNGARQVQYYDKSRMEISDPSGDSSVIWYVTNGLLALELISGRQQVGDSQWEPHSAAVINVAGDEDDPSGPIYATFAALRAAAPRANGSVITERVDREGRVTDDLALAEFDVTSAYLVGAELTNHQVASPFWAFVSSSGIVYENDAFVTAPLFLNAFYATGFPITEAYWASVKVGNTYRDVLMQCFERRILTYTPTNPEGWQVETGNVGRHYYKWRYGTEPETTPVQREHEVFEGDGWKFMHHSNSVVRLVPTNTEELDKLGSIIRDRFDDDRKLTLYIGQENNVDEAASYMGVDSGDFSDLLMQVKGTTQFIVAGKTWGEADGEPIRKGPGILIFDSTKLAETTAGPKDIRIVATGASIAHLQGEDIDPDFSNQLSMLVVPNTSVEYI